MFYEELKYLFIISMSAYNLPNYKSFEQFNGGSYTNDEYVTKNYLGGSNVSIANTASSTTNIGDTLYANTTTTDNNPAGSRVICDAPLQLPSPYSTNWTNVPLTMCAYQNIQETSLGVSTTNVSDLKVHKIGQLITLTLNKITVASSLANETYIQFNLSAYPEIIPEFTLTEVTNILVDTTYYTTICIFSNTGIFNIYRNFNGNTVFDTGVLVVFKSITMSYVGRDDRLGY